MGLRKFHLKIDIKGALMRSDKELAGMFEANGRPLTARQARAFLAEELGKGHKVLPCSKNCEGFDYFGAGCPGHEIKG